MASPSGDVIHFGCPRCCASLKAPAKHIGRQQHCPLCHFSVTIPAHSRPEHVEQYVVLDETAEPPIAQPEIALSCPVCRTRMTAPEDQAGQEIICPDCGTPSTVPAKSEPEPKHDSAPVGEYAVGEDYNAEVAPVAEPVYISLHCRLCDTLMQAPEEQAGKNITCPDCGKVNLVPAAPRKRAGFHVASDQEYAVHEEVGQPPPGSVAYEPHVGFKCTACGTRLHATVAEAGREMTCPDCGRTAIVPAPRAKPPKHDFLEEIVGEYRPRAGLPPPRPTPRVVRPWRWGPSKRPKGEGDEEDLVPPEPPPPPRWPLLSGVFNFPWYRTSVLPWLGLSICGIAEVFLIYVALSLSSAGLSLASAGTAFLGGCAMCCGAMWIAVCFSSGLAIACDTAAGCDDVGSWPNPASFLDWVGEVFFLTNSVVLIGVFGTVLIWLLDYCEMPQHAVPIVAAVLFPFVLMSMLEVNSPVVPFSPLVWRSVWRKWWAWALFYLETTLVLAVAGGLSIAALVWLGLQWTILLAPPVIVAAVMIYFRLLGRLAWWCSQTQGPEDRGQRPGDGDQGSEDGGQDSSFEFPV
jgi:DNA-directed RNA polymerase subunit RPC12/RpoP